MKILKISAVFLFVLVVAVSSFGQDVLPGKTILLEGVITDGIHIKKQIYSKGDPLIIDGQGKTVVWGFDCPYEGFDPLEAIQSNIGRTYGNVVIEDSHNVILKNLEIWGGCNYALGVMSSDASIGSKNITIDNVHVRWGAPRGIFSGGSNLSGLTIQNSSVLYTVWGGGDTTHGIYLSGGVWGIRDAQGNVYPPISNTKILNTYVAYTGGRHCTQINGRYDGVEIAGCTFKHGQMAGLSLIGVQNANIHDNRISGCGRWGMQIYDYDWGWKMQVDDYDQVKEFLATHHCCKNVAIYNNSFMVGPHKWRWDKYHRGGSYSPDGRAVINIANDLIFLHGYQQENIIIKDNLLLSPWELTIKFQREEIGYSTVCVGNMVWCYGPDTQPGIAIPYGDGFHRFPYLQSVAPHRYSGNVVMDPEIAVYPEYLFHDEAEGAVDWSKHISVGDLTSKRAQVRGIGPRQDF